MSQPRTRKHIPPKTTDRILKVTWGAYPDLKNRKQRWGGLIQAWSTEKLDDDLYRVPRAVTLEEIDAVLAEVLRPSDSALVIYPHGTTDHGSAAMRVRVYPRET